MIKYVSCFVLLIFLFGCDSFVFSPEGENFVDVNQEPTPVSISWTTLPDTVGVWDEVTINYDIDSEQSPNQLEVLLVLNENVVSSSDYGDPIVLDTAELSDGIYSASLLAISGSGTGSLADYAGIEKNIVFSSEKTLWIDNAELNPIPKPSFQLLDDGSLRIIWKQYERPRFTGYRVREGLNGEAASIRSEVLSKGTNSWIDTNYDGRNRHYSIDVVGAGKSDIANGGVATFSTSIKPTYLTEVETFDYTETRMKWVKNRFPLSFHSYQITKVVNAVGREELLSIIGDIDQTSTVVPTPLGTHQTYYLESHSINPLYPETSGDFARVDSVKITAGRLFNEEIDEVIKLFFDGHSQTYTVVGRDTVYLLDSVDFSIIETLPLNYYSQVTFSGSRGELAVFDFTGDLSLSIYDTNSLQLLRKINLKDVYPDVNEPIITGLKFDSNGVLWYRTGYKIRRLAYRIQGIGAMNTLTGSPIDLLHLDNENNFYYAIHPGGDYFIGDIESISGNNYRNIFKNDPGSIRLHITPGITPINFLSDGNSYYGLTTSGGIPKTLEVRSIADNNLLWSMSFPADISNFSDNLSKNEFSYISESEGGFIIRNFEDGSISEIIPYEKVNSDDFYHSASDIIWTKNGIFETRSNLK